MFIAIDGGDGAGKGVQIRLLQEWLGSRGIDSVFVRDPGATALGESVRDLLLNRPEFDICPKAEMALFMASRAQLVHEKIKPALDQGKFVLVDRYLLSTVVYQGYANGADESEIDEIWKIGSKLASGVLPDLTFILDCPSEIAAGRIRRPKDRIELKGDVFHDRVVNGYRAAAQNWPKHAPGEVVLIDATQTPEQIARVIVAEINRRLDS